MDLPLLLGIFPQVLLDGLILGFMYALIALGYTMVYGVLDVINFAHSDMFVTGRFVAVERELTATVDVSVKALVVIAASLLMLLALHLLVNKTRLGTAIRAVAEDQATASLMGINVDRMISITFLIGGAMGGAAGVLFGVQYSLVNPYTGFIPGLKAFTAAVLGGIGNIPGAMVGGLVLGLLE